MSNREISSEPGGNPSNNNSAAQFEELFCEVCGFYPLTPVHGHFECPQCKYKTKCCEGMAL